MVRKHVWAPILSLRWPPANTRTHQHFLNWLLQHIADDATLHMYETSIYVWITYALEATLIHTVYNMVIIIADFNVLRISSHKICVVYTHLFNNQFKLNWPSNKQFYLSTIMLLIDKKKMVYNILKTRPTYTFKQRIAFNVLFVTSSS